MQYEIHSTGGPEAGTTLSFADVHLADEAWDYLTLPDKELHKLYDERKLDELKSKFGHVKATAHGTYKLYQLHRTAPVPTK